MAVVGAQPFPVGGEPGAYDLVFGAREEDVAIFGVSIRSGGLVLRTCGICRDIMFLCRCVLYLGEGPFLDSVGQLLMWASSSAIQQEGAHMALQ